MNETYSQNLARQIKFQVYGEDIILHNNFSIIIVNNKNDTLRLTPISDNIVRIPYLFCNQDILRVVFSCDKHKLLFNNIYGSDINSDTKWKFKILKYPFNDDKLLLNKVPKEVKEVFIWQFEPEEKDGWFIYEPNFDTKQ